MKCQADNRTYLHHTHSNFIRVSIQYNVTVVVASGFKIVSNEEIQKLIRERSADFSCRFNSQPNHLIDATQVARVAHSHDDFDDAVVSAVPQKRPIDSYEQFSQSTMARLNTLALQIHQRITAPHINGLNRLIARPFSCNKPILNATNDNVIDNVIGVRILCVFTNFYL